MLRKSNLLTLAYLMGPPMFWGGNAVLGRALADDVPPIALSLLRWALSALVLLAFNGGALWRRRADIARHWPGYTLTAFLGISCYNALQYAALHTSTPVSATLINAAGPAFVLMFGLAFFGQRGTWGQAFAAVVSMSGVAMIFAQGSLERLLGLQFVPGDLLMLLATVIWSYYTLMVGRVRPDWPGFDFLTLQIALGAVMLVPAAAVEAALFDYTVVFNTRLTLSLVYLVLGPSIIAYLCYERAVARAGAGLTIYFANLIPLFAAVFSYLFLSDPIGWHHGVAAVLMFLGIAMFQRFAPRKG